MVYHKWLTSNDVRHLRPHSNIKTFNGLNGGGTIVYGVIAILIRKKINEIFINPAL